MAWLPFLLQAVLLLMSAMLISRLVLPNHGRDVAVSTAAGRYRRRFPLGLASRRHSNSGFDDLHLQHHLWGAWSVLVLYTARRLGLGEIGFGLITTVSAVGGVLGTLGYGWLTRRLSPET